MNSRNSSANVQKTVPVEYIRRIRISEARENFVEHGSNDSSRKRRQLNQPTVIQPPRKDPPLSCFPIGTTGHHKRRSPVGLRAGSGAADRAAACPFKAFFYDVWMVLLNLREAS